MACFATRHALETPNEARISVSAGTNWIGSINVGSSASALEPMTRFDTDQRCRSQLSHDANCCSVKNTGMRSLISAAKSLGSMTFILARHAVRTSQNDAASLRYCSAKCYQGRRGY